MQIGYAATNTITKGQYDITCNNLPTTSSEYLCNKHNLPVQNHGSGYCFGPCGGRVTTERCSDRFSNYCFTEYHEMYTCPKYYAYNVSHDGFSWRPGKHFHSGTSSTGGGCYTKYIPAVSFIGISGETGNQPAPITTVNPGESFKIPNNTFTKTGYTFKHWQGTKGLNGNYTAGTLVTMPNINTDITMQAVWEPNTNTSFTVEFYKQE